MIYFSLATSICIVICYFVGYFDDYKLSPSMNFFLAFLIIASALINIYISIPLTVLAACLGFFRDTVS